jgi:hypothetical protein
MRGKTKGFLPFVVVAAILLSLFPPYSPSILAQEGESRLVGIVLGGSSGRLLWDRGVSTDREFGYSLGAFVDVPTPLPVLAIRAEAALLGRRTLVRDADLDPGGASDRTVGSQYLSIPVQGRVGFSVGPAMAYIVGGPSVEFLLDTECAPDFCPILREERPMVFGVGVGAGVRVQLPGRKAAALEARMTEALSEAYGADGSGVRWRAAELLLRIGFWR